MTRDSWLHFLTALVYGLVFVLSVAIVTTVVLWASGSFRLYTEPADKIKFNVNEIVISENQGEANICVVSGQAVVDESGKVISDPAFREDVKLELWHVNGINKVEEKDKIVDITVERDEEETGDTDDAETPNIGNMFDWILDNMGGGNGDADNPEGTEPGDTQENQDPEQNTNTNTTNEPILVEFGKNINIKALLFEDGYNIGGTCILRAYTMDERYKAEVRIYVDVPVDSITINSGDLLLEQVTDTPTPDTPTVNSQDDPIQPTYNKFIQGDKFNLSLNVTPARALNAIKGTKIASFSASEGIDKLTLESVGDLIDNTILVEIIASNNYSGIVTVTAKLPKYYQESYDIDDDSQYVFTTVKIEVAELKLSNIIIQNNEINDNINVELFTNSVTRISARDTGDPDIINLDLFLEPDFYNPNTNNDPLNYMISANDISLKYLSNIDSAENYIEPITITAESVIEAGYYNVIWTITANRIQLHNETIQLYVEYNDSANLEPEDVISTQNNPLECFVKYTTIDKNQLIYDSVYHYDITKTLSDDFMSETVTDTTNQYLISTPGNQGIVSVSSAVNADEHTFRKLVFFINTAGSQQNLNEVGSMIVNATQHGQIQHENINNGTIDFDMLQPMGQGTISITPYLIMTDKDGNPLNYMFQPISDLDLVDVSGLTSVESLSSPTEDLISKYVLIQKYDSITIQVTEKLDGYNLKLYNDLDSIFDTTKRTTARVDMGKVYKIARGQKNMVTLYLVGNSFLSMTEDKKTTLGMELSGLECDEFKFANTEGKDLYFNYAKITLYVPDNTLDTQVELSFDISGAMIMDVVDVGVKEVKIGTPAAGDDSTVTLSVSDNKLHLFGRIHSTAQSVSGRYNLHFSDSNYKQFLFPTELVPDDVSTLAITQDGKKYSLYRDDVVLDPLTYSGTIRILLANKSIDINNLNTDNVTGTVSGDNLTLNFRDNADSIITTFTSAEEYAEIVNNSVIVKKPVIEDKQLVVVYMLNEDIDKMRLATAGNDTILTPMSMFAVEARFNNIKPSVQAYMGPAGLDITALGEGYVELGLDSSTNFTLTLLDDNLQKPTNAITFTSATDYVAIDALGIIREQQNFTDPSQDIYLVYVGQKDIQTTAGTKAYYISKIMRYDDSMNGTNLNKLTLNVDDEAKGTASITLTHATTQLWDGKVVYNTTNPSSIELQLLNTEAQVIQSPNFLTDVSNHNVISLVSTIDSGYKLTKDSTNAITNFSAQVAVKVHFDVVISPTDTSSRATYTATIRYDVVLPTGYYLHDNTTTS